MLPMMKTATFLAAYALICCVGDDPPSDQDILTQCWRATQFDTPEHPYELTFEALVIPGVEGITVARSRACPEMRLGFAAVPPDVGDRLRRISYSVSTTRLGAGLRGRARVVPLERRTEHFLAIRVIEMLQLERMTDAETQEFIETYRIG